MTLIPYQFLCRVAYPCRYRKDMPLSDADRLLDLPAEYQLANYTAADERRHFADIALAWNELGLGVQVAVHGKENPPQGDARTSHRASRYCHQVHFLATGGGPDHDEPAMIAAKINRALADAPFAVSRGASVPFLLTSKKNGYILEAFLSASVLHGYDPEQHPRLGFYVTVRDNELGEQFLSVGPEFPFWEDPSLWSVLELVR
jgi:hypothetical protein